jgi:NADH-quinone oxidoreductase subunit K
MDEAGLYTMLGIGGLLFGAGLFILLTRTGAVLALVGIELMLNAANINFVAFNNLYPKTVEGNAAALFILVLAAAEAAVGLALVVNVYRARQTAELENISELGG